MKTVLEVMIHVNRIDRHISKDKLDALLSNYDSLKLLASAIGRDEIDLGQTHDPSCMYDLEMNPFDKERFWRTLSKAGLLNDFGNVIFNDEDNTDVVEIDQLLEQICLPRLPIDIILKHLKDHFYKYPWCGTLTSLYQSWCDDKDDVMILKEELMEVKFWLIKCLSNQLANDGYIMTISSLAFENGVEIQKEIAAGNLVVSDHDLYIVRRVIHPTHGFQDIELMGVYATLTYGTPSVCTVPMRDIDFISCDTGYRNYTAPSKGLFY